MTTAPRPIPIGGGEGFAGNANAVSSRNPAANLKRLYPVSYGSSHIQAIAFRPHGRLTARTILTYGESMDRDPEDLPGPDPAVQPGALGQLPVDRPAGATGRGPQLRPARAVGSDGTRPDPRRSTSHLPRGRGPVERGQPSWPRSWARTRARIRETCIWVTPISSAIWAWVCCLKNRR